MAGRPPKPVKLIKLEGKGHRTKAELKAREKEENRLLTGIPMKAWKEVRADKIASKEFTRVKKLLQKIDHNDALYEAVINRYCVLVAECKRIEQTVEQLRAEIKELAGAYHNDQIDFMTYLQEKGNIHGRIIAWDKALTGKRKMLLQIERENIMTILAALRSIPKTPPKGEESPMAEYLRRKREGQQGR